MSSAVVAIPLALATTSVFNGGLIVEKHALSRMPALSPRQPGRAIASLLSSPTWLAGLSLMLTGLACQVIVLTLEPISLVQPVLAVGVAVTLVLSRLILRERLGRAGSGHRSPSAC
jgi:drug/metabolite transporter (DMT)-like permease